MALKLHWRNVNCTSMKGVEQMVAGTGSKGVEQMGAAVLEVSMSFLDTAGGGEGRENIKSR